MISHVKVQWSAFPMLLAIAAVGCGTNQAVVRHDDPGVGGGGAGGSGSSVSSGPEAACLGQCAPLGPGEWLGPLLLWIGKEGEAPECPPSAPVDGSLVFTDLNAPNTCGVCKCDAPSGACTRPISLTAGAATCAGEGSGVPHTSFDAPAGWTGACTAASPIPKDQKCNNVNCVQSLTIAPLALAETACAVTVAPIAEKLSYTWGTAARSCHGLTQGSCASPSEICAPAAEAGFAQCLVREGDKECPAPYTVRHVFYDDLMDTRSCSPCSCSAPVGGTCSSFVSVFSDGSCSSPVGAVTVDATGSKCFDIAPSGQALGSKLATEPVYSPGVCQISGGEPSGEAVPAEPSTFCCLP